MFPRYRDAIRTYETVALREIVDLVTVHTKRRGAAKILDISNDLGIFTSFLCDRIGIKNGVFATRDNFVKADPDYFQTVTINLSTKEEMMKSLRQLGTFDVIIVNDVLDEVHPYLTHFLEMLKSLLASDKGVIVILFRAKSPPPPLPPVTFNTWIDTAIGRQNVFDAVFETINTQEDMFKAELLFDCYSVSCPLKLDRQLWAKILKSRCIAPVRNCYGCNNRVIDKFIATQDYKVQFEEKHFVFVCCPEPQ